MGLSMYSHMQLLFTKSSFPAYFTPVHTSKLQRPVCSILVPFLDVHSRGNVRLSDLVQVVQQPALVQVEKLLLFLVFGCNVLFSQSSRQIP